MHLMESISTECNKYCKTHYNLVTDFAPKIILAPYLQVYH